MPHWALPLIGLRYEPRAKGPDAFDCWGLCVHIWRTQFGIDHVPDVAIDLEQPRDMRRRFEQAVTDGEACSITQPFEGCAVYMSRARLPDHIGIYVDISGGGVVHALERSGVVFTKLSALPMLGLKVLGFYRPANMLGEATIVIKHPSFSEPLVISTGPLEIEHLMVAVGDAGPEAVMPLSRGANGKLGNPK